MYIYIYIYITIKIFTCVDCNVNLNANLKSTEGIKSQKYYRMRMILLVIVTGYQLKVLS